MNCSYLIEETTEIQREIFRGFRESVCLYGHVRETATDLLSSRVIYIPAK